MSRNIVIFPNRNTTVGGSEPTITFSGASAGTITLKVEDDGSVVYEGDTGGLFSIEDNKDGLIHSVNDVSGLPIFQVWDDNMVKMGKWNSNTLIVSGNSWNVLVGDSHTISDETSLYSSIIGGTGHTISPSVINTVIVGGVDVTGTSSNSVYVPQLNISTLGTGTSVNTIGIDSNGIVVSAVTANNPTFQFTSNGRIKPFTDYGSVVSADLSSILGGSGNTITHENSNIIGSDLSSISANTTHIENLKAFGQAVGGFNSVSITTGTTETIDWNDGNFQEIDLESKASGSTITFEFTNPFQGASYSLKIIQGVNSISSTTWPANVKWDGGTAYNPTLTNNAEDIISFLYDGVNYYGNFGKNYA